MIQRHSDLPSREMLTEEEKTAVRAEMRAMDAATAEALKKSGLARGLHPRVAALRAEGHKDT